MTRVDPALALVLGSLLAAPACQRPGAASSVAPDRVPGSTAPALYVPYPVADVERIEGVGRASLAGASFVVVGLGGPLPERDHALPERIASDAPFLVAHHVEPERREWMTLQRLAFGRVEPTRGQAIEVDPVEVQQLGLRPPADAVWLVGPRGTCRALVGTPVVAAYDSRETLMVGYRLDDCPGREWAQIGIVADAIPVDFRWVPALAAEEVVVPHGTVVDDPLVSLISPPAWSYEDAPAFEVVQVREIPEAEPRVVQARRAWLSAVPEAGDPAWCEARAAWTRVDGWYNGRWIDAVPFTRDAVAPFLLGAFVNGTQVDALIYDDRLDGLVVVPPGPLDDVDDPEAWTQVFVPTGPYDRAELEAWGVEPARGPLPIGRPCELAATADSDLDPDAQ